MVQLGEELRFALEAGEALLVLGERRRQDLDRHFALELVSVARYTSPMPPSPSLAVIS